MQKIITLILALALYAPNVAGLLAYSECEIVAMLNKQPDCDCQLNTTPQQNSTTNIPHKYKLEVQQPDWKYIPQNSFLQAAINEANAGSLFQQYQSPYHSLLIAKGIFRPPCC